VRELAFNSLAWVLEQILRWEWNQSIRGFPDNAGGIVRRVAYLARHPEPKEPGRMKSVGMARRRGARSLTT